MSVEAQRGLHTLDPTRNRPRSNVKFQDPPGNLQLVRLTSFGVVQTPRNPFENDKLGLNHPLRIDKANVVFALTPINSDI